MKFSLLMSVYKKDNPQFFDQALQSVESSTIKPTEVVLVCDGQLTTELEQIIDKYENRLPINLIRLPNNVGLGQALQIGMNHCQYEWIARFDADDICSLDRFAEQIAFIENQPDIDVVGGQIIEFDKDPHEQNLRKKRVPMRHDDICHYAKSRNPMNHMTVMFRKSAVIEAGNYQHAPLYEDYDLWVRMLIKGFRFANIDDVLVYARAGDKMYLRRGGMSYAKQEVKMQIGFYRLEFISAYQVSKNLMIRIPIRLVSNRVRSLAYAKILRQ